MNLSITVVLHFLLFLDYLLILTRFVYIPIIKNVRVFLVILIFTLFRDTITYTYLLFMTFKFVCLTTMYIKIKVELQNSRTVTKLNFNTFFQFNHREQTFLSRVKPKNKYTRSIQLSTKTSILLVKNYFTSASPPPRKRKKILSIRVTISHLQSNAKECSVASVRSKIISILKSDIKMTFRRITCLVKN